VDTVRKFVTDQFAGPEGNARFPDAAGSGQGNEANRFVAQHGQERVEFPITPNQWGERYRPRSLDAIAVQQGWSDKAETLTIWTWCTGIRHGTTLRGNLGDIATDDGPSCSVN
jgi:hypothetical protein